MSRHIYGALLLLLLGGCMVGPDYHRPAPVLSAQYKELAGWVPAHPADDIPKGAWWLIYHDPFLTSLEGRVAVSNQTIANFAAQYAQAQAIVDETRAQLFPVLGATASVTRSRAGSGGVGTGGGGTRTQYIVQGSASWDLDLWGRIRRQVQSDVAAAQVSVADLRNAVLSAQASLATDYAELRYEDSLFDLLQATVEAYRTALRITHNQVVAGIAAPGDEALAATQLASAQASLVNVGVARGQYEHAIAVLAGLPPANLAIPHAGLGDDVPVVPAGVPSVLLQRRPDIAAAERTMAQENALIGVQVAAFYPDVTLSADFGWEGGPIGMLFSAANRVWSLGAGATETLFEGGARSAAVRAARAAYDASVASYRQTVLSALEQVEDDLVALRVLQTQAAAEDAAVLQARRSVAIALNEYRAGTQAYTTLITAQTALLSNEQAALSVREQRWVASVALVQALGGSPDAQ
jgi:NodT family efflux transporter outer membrane factor (OMF) lipoprotein